MADTKITGLATGTTLHSDDWLVYVDTHDTSMAASGTDKKVSPATVAAAMTIAESQVTGLITDLGTLATDVIANAAAIALKAPLASPTFTGTVTLPTGLTGLLKAASGVVSTATAGTDYLTPSGSGAGLTGITAGQVGGLAASATTDTTSASNITSGTLPAARLPNPSATTLGGIQSAAAVSNQWIASISTGGVPSLSQPAFTNISGTVAASQLPNPSATTLGGIQSAAAVSHQWIASISTSGVPSLSQPAFSDISGSVAASQLPNPSATTLGGIQSLAAVASNWINAISTSGVPSATQPAFSDLSGSIAAGQIPAGILTYSMLNNESASTLLGNPTGSAAAPSEVTLGPNLALSSGALRSRVPIYSALSSGTAVANSTALTSIFAGVATSLGSLTIPANTLVAGSHLTLMLFGTWGATTGSPTFYIKVTLGGTLVCQSQPSVVMTASAVTNFSWAFQYVNMPGLLVQSTGTSGKVIGGMTLSPQAGATQVLTAAGTVGAPASAVTINTTTALAIDVQVQWGTANAANTFQLLGASIFLDY